MKGFITIKNNKCIIHNVKKNIIAFPENNNFV